MEINFILLYCRSKTQKRGDDKDRRKRSPSPKPTKIHLGRLTRNVTKVGSECVCVHTDQVDPYLSRSGYL